MALPYATYPFFFYVAISEGVGTVTTFQLQRFLSPASDSPLVQYENGQLSLSSSLSLVFRF